MAVIRNLRFSSGLELVHYEIPQTKFVDVALGIGVGTRHEPPGLGGIAHFTEHVLFRGCRSLPSSYELNFEFDRIGDGLNAHTHKEYTMLTTKVPSDALARALGLMAKVVQEPLFKDVDTERGIILEETLEELDERGKESDLDNLSRAKIFGKHPLGRPVLGRPASIKKISAESLREFHSTHYVPSNMVLGVAGGISWAQCLKLAKDAFGDAVPLRQEKPSEPLSLEPGDLRSGLNFIEGKGSQVEVLLSFFMPGERSPGELARLFIARILDDGLSSRLQRTICERRGLLYDISCGVEAFTDVSLFDVQFSVSSRKLREVIEVILGQLKILATEKVEAKEFEVVRERFRRDVRLTAESSHAMATLMAEAFLLRLPTPLEPQEYEVRLREITPAAILAEAASAFTLKNLSFFVKGKMSSIQKREVRKALRLLA